MKSDYWLTIAPTQGIRAVGLPLWEGETVLGSAADCDVVLADATVSRHHALLTIQGETVEIRDHGASSGIQVNGQLILSRELAPSDEIALGDVILHISKQAPSASSGSPATATACDSGQLNLTAFSELLLSLKDSKSPILLATQLLQGLVSVFGATRGFVLLRQAPDKSLRPVTKHCLDDSEELMSISSSVCREACKTLKPVVIPDSSVPGTWSTSQSLAGLSPRTVLCGPLHVNTSAFGAVYIDMPRSEIAISPQRLQLFSAVNGVTAQLLEGLVVRESLDTARTRIHSLNRSCLISDGFVAGESDTAIKLIDRLNAASRHDVTVLITGETGTGKDVTARNIHLLSDRRDKPFIPVNCAALPPDIIEAELFGSEMGAFTGSVKRTIGRFELANEGTFFLDEIGKLSLELQVKLLRVIEERSITRIGGTGPLPVDFRLICATNVDLVEAVRDGSFREDLFFRIDVFRIHMEPLRKRKPDILIFAKHFLDSSSRKFGKSFKGFTPDAKKTLTTYGWPGNLRELRNAIERAVVMEDGTHITEDSLALTPFGDSATKNAAYFARLIRDFPTHYESAQELFDTAFIHRSFTANNGNISAMAREAGLTRPTIYRRLKNTQDPD